MSSDTSRLATVATFKGLSADDLTALESQLEQMPVARGTCLVTEGDEADALFVVVSGRFAVEVGGNPEPVTEIGQGATIGEIAFFAGGSRTATVRAIRDSVVVRLSRADFDDISRRTPAIWNDITATIASRLAAETRKSSALQHGAWDQPRAGPRPRTLALVPAGSAAVPADFLSAFCDVARRDPQTLVVSSGTIADHLNGRRFEVDGATHELNELEARYQTIVFIADATLTPWSQKAIRQADEVLAVGAQPDGPLGLTVPLNEIEKFAAALLRPPALRLVLLHPRPGSVEGTRHWLAQRAVQMHHHLATGVTDDVERLWRFIRGQALGFVACGGGAYCAAHIGIYKAFRECGTSFDLLGGASGGAAMAAAFAQDLSPDEIDARVHRMFITGKALARYTLPRYSLLDHTHFDHHLMTEYGNVRIEDLWKPYFAVSADLTNYRVEMHRTGLLWQAIRSSASIPGLLPPFYSGDGRMLVDGSVIANVPIDSMHSLKTGPNIVVSFNPRDAERFEVDYAALPARKELIWRSINPFSKNALPHAPSPASVLIRSLMANRTHYESHLEAGDWLLIPPTPVNMGALDWRRHTELVETAYRFGLDQIRLRGVVTT